MHFDEVRPGIRLAWLAEAPNTAEACGFFWLGGFMSDMTGGKAEALADLARETARPCLRFDYSGHGASGGAFAEGTISAWLEEALHMFRVHAPGPRILVGSSMGGWLAALLYRGLGSEARRVKGLVLIAPAHDMTEALMWHEFSATQRSEILERGLWHRPSAYGAPCPITRRLIEDGRRHLLRDEPFPVSCPVRILQGTADADVPWQHAHALFGLLRGDDIRLTLVKDGDHRLSRRGDLELLRRTVLELAEQADRG